MVLPPRRSLSRTDNDVCLTGGCRKQLTGFSPPVIKECWDSIEALSKEIQSYDRQLSELAKQSESAKRLMTIPGIGEITATGLVATISDGKQYDNGRQLAAWLGLVPRQYSTGGNPVWVGSANKETVI